MVKQALVAASLALVVTVGFFSPTEAADSYCNGQPIVVSGMYHYPNGQPVVKDGLYRYPDGKATVRNSLLRYPNGQSIISGGVYYYPNGRVVNKGAKFYYPNGKLMYADGTPYNQDGTPAREAAKSLVENVGMWRIEFQVSSGIPIVSNFMVQAKYEGYRLTFAFLGGAIANISAECER